MKTIIIYIFTSYIVVYEEIPLDISAIFWYFFQKHDITVLSSDYRD